MTTRLMLGALSICLWIFVAGCERKVAFQEQDKLMFLRAGDLLNYGFQFQGIEKYESFSKSRNIDGTYDIEYEFRTPEEEQNNQLFLYVMVSIGKDKSDARLSQKVEKLALLYGLNRKGVQEHEIADFYRYGEASSFYVLKKQDTPVGNYFTVREGNKTYTLLITGMYFEDPGIWKEIIEPRLKHFSAHKRT